MIGLDLRNVGQIIGLQLYVDVSDVDPEYRDQKAEDAQDMLRKMAGMDKVKYKAAETERDDEQLHWVEGDKNGKQINILHWAGCEGRCEAYIYLEDHKDLDIRKGRDYTLKKINGTWVLEEMKKNDADTTTKS